MDTTTPSDLTIADHTAATTSAGPADVAASSEPAVTPVAEAASFESPSTVDAEPRPELSTWERIEASADHLEDRLEEVVRDQRARRIVVRDDDRIVADFPLAIGVAGALLAAPVAAIAAIVALLNDCTIEVEHVTAMTTSTAPSATVADADVATAS